MRVYVRVGLGAGIIGFALLYMAEWRAGLAALALLAPVALLAGLGVAKWLPRDWYGRQLVAGVRAGAIACGLAVVGLLVSLGVTGPHAIPALARLSHLFDFNLANAVRTLGVVGWLGAGLALSVAGAVLGAGLTALVALVGAWGKNRRAIEVVEQAREAAQRSARLFNSDGPSTSRPVPTSEWQPVRYPASLPPGPASAPDDSSMQGNTMHEALAAWAEPNPGGKKGKSGGKSGKIPPPPQRSDQDSWLC